MQVFERIKDFQEHRKGFSNNLSVGFVPTMGALHQGHASLFQNSIENCDITVASIFVNPTQFNDPSDLQKYPKTWDEDIALLQSLGVDYLLYPSYDDLYPDDYRYRVSENLHSKVMEGKFRDQHFDGVLTVVLKLLIAVQADQAFFGAKDYQQFTLIKGLAEAFLLPTQIVPCETIRESNGLAMSSRNTRLTDSGRETAAKLFQVLSEKQEATKCTESLKEAGFSVEYVEDLWGRRFAACFLEGVRLIDNVSL